MSTLIMFDIDGTLVKTDEEDTIFEESIREWLLVDSINTDWMSYKHVTDSGIAIELFEQITGTLPKSKDIDDVTDIYSKKWKHKLESIPTACIPIKGVYTFLKNKGIIMSKFKKGRHFLNAGDWKNYEGTPSDEQLKLSHPPVVKPVPEEAEPMSLVKPEDFTSGGKSFINLVNQRKSRRKYTDDHLTYEELSYLIWCTQGVKKTLRNGVATFRTVPSGGARHSFETYLWINRVEGLTPGLYRYLPLEHQIIIIREAEDKGETLSSACLGQSFVGKAAVAFIWTTIPYRAEWRYSVVAHKMIAIDAGHMCQNLYLAAESIGAGACAVGAYDQKKMDHFLSVDGDEEFTIYIAPVGKVRK